jgi:hypothetical protein
MTVINMPQRRPHQNGPADTSTSGLTEFTRIEIEALVRFAAELLHRAGWNAATPEGMEKAYLDTIPVECDDEELHVYMQGLGQQVYRALREDFRIWAYRELTASKTTR